MQTLRQILEDILVMYDVDKFLGDDYPDLVEKLVNVVVQFLNRSIGFKED